MTEAPNSTSSHQALNRPAGGSMAGPTLAGGFPGPAGQDSFQFSDRVFSVDEATFRSSLPKVTHWSVAWSDLMMTMFILFLSLFVYQAAHKEFLVSDEIEVVGGETSTALEIADEDQASFPFLPIESGAPLITSGTVKKVEPIHLQDIEVESGFFNEQQSGGIERIEASLSGQETVSEVESAARPPQETAELEDPTRITVTQPEDPEEARIDRIFTLDNSTLAQLNLEKFASIDLVPDKTTRIILTGDLLFETGAAELSRSSMTALKKISAVIKNSPYMINVVGHTDNIPMHSERYETNWELSVARASRVARFMIEEIGMNPNQFVVSGYGPYRPIRPNNNAKNRAVNRRVEIIISKKLPRPVAATSENIN